MENKVLLLKTNQKTKTDRIYPKEVVEAAIKNPIFQELLADKSVFCTFEAPAYDYGRVDISLISHVITNVFFIDDDLYGDVEILDTQQGQKFTEALAAGKTLELELHGSGSIYYDCDKEVHVVDYLSIISFNWVIESPTTEENPA